MILFGAGSDPGILNTCIFYDEDGVPFYVHPLAEKLGHMSKKGAIEYLKLKGQEYVVHE